MECGVVRIVLDKLEWGVIGGGVMMGLRKYV
jgi:hypothetical protein